MPTCPKCEKQELKPGEDLCPHCKNKKTNFWVKIGEAAVAVVGIVVVILTGGKGEKT